MTAAFDIDTCAATIRRDNSGVRLCNIAGCDARTKGRGLCTKHWKRWSRWGDPHKIHPRYTQRATPKPRQPAPPKPKVTRAKKRKRSKAAPFPAPWKPGVPDWVDLAALTAHTPADGWRRRAACADTDPALFFPPSMQHSAYGPPLEVCARCPVRLDCLVDNLTEDHGCWAATPAQRRHIRTALKQRSAA